MVLKRVAAAAVLLACGLAFVASVSAGGQSDKAAKAGGTEVKLTINADPGVVDPSTQWLYDTGNNMFVALVGYDYAKNEVVPRGAVSWTVSADNLVWTFSIRKNWKWSDGQPVTAKDYEYAFQEIVNPKSAAPHVFRLSIIKNADAINKGEKPITDLGVRAVDDSTLQITLNEPASWFLSSLTSIGHAIPKWTREKFGADWTKPENIVVNGPYKVTKWVTDNELTFEKNASYYDAAKVNVDKITMYVINSESTAMAMYEKGDIDTTLVPSTDLARVAKDPVLSKEFKTTAQLNVYFYRFFVLKAPFDNVLARKAFAAALDRDTIINTIERGYQVPAYTMTPPGCVGYVNPSEGVGIKFDPKAAAKYLADAGYPGGKGLPPLVLGYNASERHARIAQAVQKMWKDYLGVEVSIKGFEGSSYGPAQQTGAIDIMRGGWGMDYPDGNNVWGELFASTSVQKGGLGLPEVDKLIAQAAGEPDLAKRKALYKQIEKIYIQDNAAVIPILYNANNYVAKPWLNRPVVSSFNNDWWTWSVNKK